MLQVVHTNRLQDRDAVVRCRSMISGDDVRRTMGQKTSWAAFECKAYPSRWGEDGGRSILGLHR